MAPPYNLTASGTVTFAATAASGFGTCISLAGAGMMVVPTGPLDFSPYQAWTVLHRFKTVGTALQIHWGTGTGATTYVATQTGNVTLAINSTTNLTSSGTSFNDGAWHEIAAVYTGTYGVSGTTYPMFYLYVDGVLRASKEVPSWTPPTVGKMALGSFGNTSVSFGFVGSLDDVRVFWSALYTGGTVNGAAVYTPVVATGSDSAANQVAHWNLDDAGPTTANDTNTTVVPPIIRSAITVATAAGTDTVTYPAATAGTNSLGGYELWGATTKGSEALLTSTASTGAGSLTHAQAAAGAVEYYIIKAKDNAGSPTYSPPSNEVAAPGAGVTTAPNAASLISSVSSCAYSPWNWNVTAARAVTVNPGAYVRFDVLATTRLAITCDYSIHNYFLARVDGGAWVTYQPDLYVQIASGLTNRRHTLEILYTAMDPRLDLWTSPVGQSALSITGIVTDTGSSITLPTRRKYNVLFMGDSITCGFDVHGTSYLATPPVYTNSDASCCFSWLMSQNLDAEVGVVGFGSQGVTVAGLGNVPAMTNASGAIVAGSAYNHVYSGVSRVFDGSANNMPVPDLVIWPQGFNDADQGASPATSNIVTVGMVNMINAVLAVAPRSKHLVLSPITYTGKNAPAMALVPGQVGSPQVSYLDVHSGIGGSGDIVGAVHPYDYVHISLLAPLVFNAAVPILFPGGRRKVW